MERLLSLMTLFSALLLVLVLRSVRKAHIRVEYSVSWLGAAVALLILSRMEGPLRELGKWIGIPDPALTLAFLVGGIFLIVLYKFSVVISSLKDANISLAQRVAILEYYVNRLNGKQESET